MILKKINIIGRTSWLLSKVPGFRSLNWKILILYLSIAFSLIATVAIAVAFSYLSGIAIGTVALASVALISTDYAIGFLYKKGKQSLLVRKQNFLIRKQNLDKKIIANQIHKNVYPLSEKNRDALYNAICNTFNDRCFLSNEEMISTLNNIPFPIQISREQAIENIFSPLSSEQKIALLKKPLNNGSATTLFGGVYSWSFNSICFSLLKALFKDLSTEQRIDVLSSYFDHTSWPVSVTKPVLEILFEGMPVKNLSPLYRAIKAKIATYDQTLFMSFFIEKGLLESEPDLIESCIQNRNMVLYRNRLKTSLKASLKANIAWPKLYNLDPIEEIICDYLIENTLEQKNRPI